MMNDENLISSNPIGNTKKRVLDEGTKGLSQMDRRRFLRLTGAAFGAVTFGGMMGSVSDNVIAKAIAATVKPMAMPPVLVPTPGMRYINQLVIPPVYVPDADGIYRVNMTTIAQQILPAPFGKTRVYAYSGRAKSRNGAIATYTGAPGASFEAVRNTPLRVQWTNSLTGLYLLPIDPLLHWANPKHLTFPAPNPIPPDPTAPYPDEYPWSNFQPPFQTQQTPIPATVHLHGAETLSQFDGHPDSWWTPGLQYRGPAFSTTYFSYPNSQLSTMLFYHDHALGITRLNVYMGLAGLYFIRDPCGDYMNAVVPPIKYEIPLAIQDRAFYQATTPGGNNELAYPPIGNIPTMHPYWNPEFSGEMLGYPAPGSPSTCVILVNGKAWPNLNVDRGQYRFRIVNASNSRFYHLYFSNGMSFVQIGTEQGYLRSAVTLNSNPVINSGSLILAPAERADILVDFSKIAPGTGIELLNNAPSPYPMGDLPNPLTSGSIMHFQVGSAIGFTPKKLPQILTPTLATYPMPAGTTSRYLTLMEQLQPSGPYTGEPRALFLNGQMWDAAISELPRNGSTEDWYYVNLTGDTHPMHLHLVQVQLISRRPFNVGDYQTKWDALNAPGLVHPPPDNGLLPLNMNWPTVTVPPSQILYTGPAVGPAANETGWKDTVRANPGEITRIRARFKSQDGKPFPFDPTSGPGYVWHCHIIEHEDNEMMRPFKVVK
jgi:spore coat protein A, manganese oxidase